MPENVKERIFGEKDTADYEVEEPGEAAWWWVVSGACWLFCSAQSEQVFGVWTAIKF
jgi:hypothetical protein